MRNIKVYTKKPLEKEVIIVNTQYYICIRKDIQKLDKGKWQCIEYLEKTDTPDIEITEDIAKNIVEKEDNIQKKKVKAAIDKTISELDKKILPFRLKNNLKQREFVELVSYKNKLLGVYKQDGFPYDINWPICNVQLDLISPAILVNTTTI